MVRDFLKFLTTVLPVTVWAALVSGCLTSGMYSKEAAQKTWENAEIRIPGVFFKSHVRDDGSLVNEMMRVPDGFAILRPGSSDFQQRLSMWVDSSNNGKRVPVAILMHNCGFTGLQRFQELFAEAGVVTVAPDSAARNRGMACDPLNHTGGLIPDVYEMRKEEVDIALREILRWPWADHSKLFLAGHSEGGWIAAGYPGTQFAGRIIEGSKCYDGVQAGGKVEILIINGTNDPWIVNNYRCHAAPNVRHLMIEGGGHRELQSRNATATEEARALIARVLSR